MDMLYKAYGALFLKCSDLTYMCLILILIIGCKEADNESKNSSVNSNYFTTSDSTKIYYQDVGDGVPIVFIHGNSGSINSMSNQIDYFKTSYRVITADSRGHGKSDLNTDSLTYNQIASDLEQLIRHLKLDSVHLVGWSDGGIVALKMGISGKTPIKKIVAMGANLRPDSTAVHQWAIDYDSESLKKVKKNISEGDTTENWLLQKQLLELLLHQPQISHDDLSNITAEVLIMAGDEDISLNHHTVEMYEHIPQAQLCIMPGENHYTPTSNPDKFNRIVDEFLSQPFSRPYSN